MRHTLTTCFWKDIESDVYAYTLTHTHTWPNTHTHTHTHALTRHTRAYCSEVKQTAAHRACTQTHTHTHARARARTHAHTQTELANRIISKSPSSSRKEPPFW